MLRRAVLMLRRARAARRLRRRAQGVADDRRREPRCGAPVRGRASRARSSRSRRISRTRCRTQPRRRSAAARCCVGGLTPADVSSDEIVTATRSGSQRVGRIPTPLHDSAAVTLGAETYLFGGGTGTAQIDTILEVDPRTGAAQVAGHLPAGSSDQSAAAIGRTAYIVGGYTGTRWLDTIVAWSPGGPRESSRTCRTRSATPPWRLPPAASSSPAARSRTAPRATRSTPSRPARYR